MEADKSIGNVKLTGEISYESAVSRVHAFFGHSVVMLKALKSQNTSQVPEATQTKIEDIYNKAIRNIETKKFTFELPCKPLDKHDIEDLAAKLKAAEKECTKEIAKAQKKVLKEVAKNIEEIDKSKLETPDFRAWIESPNPEEPKTESPNPEEPREERKIEEQESKAAIEQPTVDPKKASIDEKISILIKGGWKAKVAKLVISAGVANYIAKDWQEANDSINRARIHMEQADTERFLKDSPKGLSQVEADRLAEHESKERRTKSRAGVYKVGDKTAIEPKFTSKAIHKQLKSFIAQEISDEARETIERFVEIEGKPFASIHVPFNAALDLELREVLGKISMFRDIFGEKSVSSLNRQEQHIINAYLSKLDNSYRCFRHGILSSKLVKNTELRRQESENAAKELITAALLQTLAEQGISLEEAAKQTIPVNLSSVSLVTPDLLRKLGRKVKPRIDDERTMFHDQLQALRAMEKLPTISIGGNEIKVEVRVNTFNFGVNDGAIGTLPLLPRLGLDTQHAQNKKAWGQMKDDIAKLEKAIGEDDLSDESQALLLQIKGLEKDINELMESKTAYLKGGNQYEVGAKILNLGNLMTELAKENRDKINEANKAIELVNRVNLDKKNNNSLIPLSYNVAANCMSGKDRTGVMDATAKALHAMYLKRGYFPSHEELSTENGILRDEFKGFLKQFLMEGGGITITEINTGAPGYKVGTKTIKLEGIGLSPLFTDKEIAEIQGLSKTTSS